METLECTAGAVGRSAMPVAGSMARVMNVASSMALMNAAASMAVAAAARPVVQVAGNHLLLPTVRTHSLAGVGLYEVQGSDSGWGSTTIGNDDAIKVTDPTSFPTRLGPPPDSPPVN